MPFFQTKSKVVSRLNLWIEVLQVPRIYHYPPVKVSFRVAFSCTLANRPPGSICTGLILCRSNALDVANLLLSNLTLMHI